MKNLFTFLIVLLSPIFLMAQWTTHDMSGPRTFISGATAASADRLFIPGGIDSLGISKALTVYDIPSDTWIENIPLAEARLDISTTIHDNKLFCAGGLILEPTTAGLDFLVSDAIDIIDINTLEVLDTARLSIPRAYLSAVTVGTKVLFAGGMKYKITPFAGGGSSIGPIPTDTVDIYDTLTDTWTIAELSEPRSAMAHAVWGDKVYFAGGVLGNNEFSSRVDIYDTSTDTWTTAELFEGRAFFGKGGVAVDGKIYFAGGTMENLESSQLIDVFDVNENTWDIDFLSTPRTNLQAVATDNNIFFIGGSNGVEIGFPVPPYSNIIDVYNIPSNTWTTYEMPENRSNHAAFAVENQVFVVGGETLVNNDPTLNTRLSTMLVFDDVTTPTYDLHHTTASLHLYPNPVSDQLFIEKKETQPVQFSIVDAFGKVLLQNTANDPTTTWDISQLPSGIYFLIGKSTDGEIIYPSEKIIKQ